MSLSPARGWSRVGHVLSRGEGKCLAQGEAGMSMLRRVCVPGSISRASFSPAVPVGACPLVTG